MKYVIVFGKIDRMDLKTVSNLLHDTTADEDKTDYLQLLDNARPGDVIETKFGRGTIIVVNY